MYKVTVQACAPISGSPAVVVTFEPGVQLPHIPITRPVWLLEPSRNVSPQFITPADSGLPPELIARFPRFVEMDAHTVTTSAWSRQVFIQFWPDRHKTLRGMDRTNVEVTCSTLNVSQDFHVLPV